MANTNGNNQNTDSAGVNLSFQAKCQLIGENLGMQIQKMGDTTVYFIAPVDKEAGDGISLNEAIGSIKDAVAWFGGTFNLDTADIQKSISDIMGEKLDDIHLCLKAAYLYRKTRAGETAVSEYAIGVGVRFGTGKEQKKLFAIQELSFCVWSFGGEKGGEASAKRREAIEGRMGIVDLSSDEQIIRYIGREETKKLESGTDKDGKKGEKTAAGKEEKKGGGDGKEEGAEPGKEKKDGGKPAK